MFTNAIFPGKCIICNKIFTYNFQNIICSKCINKIQKERVIYCKSCGIKETKCQKCLKRKIFNQIKVFKNIDKEITDLIFWFKIKKYTNLSKVIADIIKDDITEFVREKQIQVITYIPLSIKIKKQRGFNHLELILKEIFPEYMIKKTADKIKETPYQMGLAKSERKRNLKDAFKLKEEITNKKILIFDDIMTTGTTMKEFYKTIKKGNPSKIYGYVIAR